MPHSHLEHSQYHPFLEKKLCVFINDFLILFIIFKRNIQLIIYKNKNTWKKETKNTKILIKELNGNMKRLTWVEFQGISVHFL